MGQPSKPPPIQPMPIPQQVWDVVYVDFLGPLPTKRPSARYYRWPYSLSRGRNSSQYERQVNHSMSRKYFFPPWHTANDCIRQWSTVPGRRNSPIYVYKWDQTPQNYAHMATSKRRSRDVHETANEVSTDGSRRTQGLETRATTIPAELPRHAPLYDESTARHSTVRTKRTHQVTREVFESKHGRDRPEDQRS